MPLSREGFLAIDNIETKEVQLPRGQSCFVRMMSGNDRDQLASIVSSDEPGPNRLTSWLVVKCLCDENGKRLLADEDLEAVGEKPSDVLEAIAEVATELNKLQKPEEVEKN